MKFNHFQDRCESLVMRHNETQIPAEGALKEFRKSSLSNTDEVELGELKRYEQNCKECDEIVGNLQVTQS